MKPTRFGEVTKLTKLRSRILHRDMPQREYFTPHARHVQPSLKAMAHEKSQQIIKSAGLFNFGRGGGIRTHDPLLPKQMRYQAALRPDKPSILA